MLPCFGLPFKVIAEDKYDHFLFVYVCPLKSHQNQISWLLDNKFEKLVEFQISDFLSKQWKRVWEVIIF